MLCNAVAPRHPACMADLGGVGGGAVDGEGLGHRPGLPANQRVDGGRGGGDPRCRLFAEGMGRQVHRGVTKHLLSLTASQLHRMCSGGTIPPCPGSADVWPSGDMRHSLHATLAKNGPEHAIVPLVVLPTYVEDAVGPPQHPTYVEDAIFPPAA